MARFFAAPHNISDHSILLSPEDSEHIKVLRLRPEELFTICNGNGIDYVCRLGKFNDGTVAEIVSQHPSLGEPTIKCRVYIAYSKGERLDYAVQKSVELGASSIILFKSNRCVSIPNNIPKKVERLQRVALETAKQCGRGMIPTVTDGEDFDSVVNDSVKDCQLSILFYEIEDNLHIKQVLEKHFPPLRKSEDHVTTTVSMITGPEGGFEPAEMRLAQTKGIHIVSLGPRILRSETAPVVALATVMYHTGNL